MENSTQSLETRPGRCVGDNYKVIDEASGNLTAHQLNQILLKLPLNYRLTHVDEPIKPGFPGLEHYMEVYHGGSRLHLYPPKGFRLIAASFTDRAVAAKMIPGDVMDEYVGGVRCNYRFNPAALGVPVKNIPEIELNINKFSLAEKSAIRFIPQML